MLRCTDHYFFKLFFVLLIVAVFSTGVFAGNGETIENLVFREADIRDVLETISEVAGVNLVIDGSVTGVINIKLEEVSFNKALEMVTTTHGLDYIREENIIIVATPERIASIFARDVIEVLSIEEVDAVLVQETLVGVFPEITAQLNRADNQLILAGKGETVEMALDLLERLNFEPEQETIIVSVSVEEAGLEEIYSIVNDVFGDLNIVINKAGQQLILQGLSQDIDSAKKFIAELDVTPGEKVVQIVDVEDGDLDSISRVVEAIYPEVNLEVQTAVRRFIVFGKPGPVEKSVDLIGKLDLEIEKEDEAEVEEIEEEEREIRILKIEHIDLDDLSRIVRNLFPDLTVDWSVASGSLVLQGLTSDIDKAVVFVSELDLESEEEPAEVEEEEEIEEEKEEEEIFQIKELKYVEIDLVRERILQVVPGLEVDLEPLNNQLILRGEPEKVEYAVLLADKMDQEHRKITEIVQLDFLEMDTGADIIRGTFPDLNIQRNSQLHQLIMTGLLKDVDNALNLLQRVDLPRDQVLIEVRIEEIDRWELLDIGVDPSELSRINIFRNESAIQLPQVLNLLAQDGKTETLANPRLMTLSGMPARLLIGDRISYPVEEVQEQQVVTTYTELEVGIILEFEPRVTSDNSVILDIAPQVSSLGESRGDIPDVNTREVETTVRLRDGETFVIGGLIQDNVRESLRKIPVLYRLPVLGELFKRTQTEVEKTELMIIITPHIISADYGTEVDEDLQGTELEQLDFEMKMTDGMLSEVPVNQGSTDSLAHSFSGDFYDFYTEKKK